jgi:hypothetical protein
VAGWRWWIDSAVHDGKMDNGSPRELVGGDPLLGKAGERTIGRSGFSMRVRSRRADGAGRNCGSRCPAEKSGLIRVLQ